MDDCLVHSPTLEQHLLNVEEVLEIFRRRPGSSTPRAPSASLGGRSSASSATAFLRRACRWTRARCSPVHRRVGDADVMRRGPPLHGAGQLLPLIRGGLLRGRGAADGTRQPHGAVRVDPGGAGELRRAEAGPLVGAGTPHL